MGLYSVVDHMVKSYRNNRALLQGRKKSLKTIYQENNYHYIKKKIVKKTAEFDEEKRQLFLQKIKTRQKKARQRQAFLLVSLILVVALIIYLLS